jgi:hypothetical protein
LKSAERAAENRKMCVKLSWENDSKLLHVLEFTTPKGGKPWEENMSLSVF